MITTRFPRLCASDASELSITYSFRRRCWPRGGLFQVPRRPARTTRPPIRSARFRTGGPSASRHPGCTRALGLMPVRDRLFHRLSSAAAAAERAARSRAISAVRRGSIDPAKKSPAAPRREARRPAPRARSTPAPPACPWRSACRRCAAGLLGGVCPGDQPGILQALELGIDLPVARRPEEAGRAVDQGLDLVARPGLAASIPRITFAVALSSMAIDISRRYIGMCDVHHKSRR